MTQSHASNFCYAKRTQKKIQLHFSPHSPQSFFSLTLHVISFNQTFFLPKRKKPDETYRKSYDVYSNRDATRSEIFVSVLSIFEATVRDIHIECSKQFKWNLYIYVSGQSRPFWSVLKLYKIQIWNLNRLTHIQFNVCGRVLAWKVK